MIEARILDRLNHLHSLATLRPEEEENEARVNEARAAALQFFRTVRQHGIAISFAGTGEVPKPPPPANVCKHGRNAKACIDCRQVPMWPDAKTPQPSEAKPIEPPEDVIEIRSKIASVCRKCRILVSSGEQVYWRKGFGVCHKRCGFGALL